MTNESVFREIISEDQEFEIKPTQIESLCMNCHQNGLTKILLTKIPHYKDIIVISFECQHCGLQNNEIQSAEKIQELGIVYKLKIDSVKDLSRQIVKSDFASVSIPEVELEIPSKSQTGEVTTVEGIIQRTIVGLNQDQSKRRCEDAEKIQNFIEQLKELMLCKASFHVILDDPSGNSYLENPYAPLSDIACVVTHYRRSKDLDRLCGVFNVDVEEGESQVGSDEVFDFPTNCPECNCPATTHMKITQIPHFKEVIIMCTVCEVCGHKTNEVKSGTGISQQGQRIQLNVRNVVDLSRDVLKSETCCVSVPELEFETDGELSTGGRFTTVEGLLVSIGGQLRRTPLISGDSAISDVKSRMDVFLSRLDEMSRGEKPFTLVMDDPAGNSYVQNLYAPETDPEMTVTNYERNFHQNEELGLNDMNVDNYL